LATNLSKVSPTANSAVEAVLRLLADKVSPCVALVVSEIGREFLIEEASINAPAGFRLRVPDEIFSAPEGVTDVSAARLPIGWTEICGWRPRYIAAVPITDHRLLLAVACAGTAPVMGDLKGIAAAVGTMLDKGSATNRERSASQRISALVDNLPFPIVFVDSRTIEVFLNDRARTLLDLGQRDATEGEIAAAFARIISGAELEHRTILAKDPNATVTFGIEDNKRQFEVESKWIDEDRLTGRLWMFRDVTGEREIARLKDDFVSTVSHELRTPLTSIIGSLTLLRTGAVGALPEQAGMLIDVARRNGDRLSRLINDLLDMDKLQSGKLDLHVRPVDVGDLLRESVQQNEPYATGYGVGLTLVLPEEPISANVDTDRMLQVLANLISNAAKFAPNGSKVGIGVALRPQALRISISDQGPGISPEFRDRLFTRFAQDGETAAKSGTGLGLAISKGIVEQHGGSLSLNSDTTIGATFDIDLPLE
jgi:signal transduction histidine kinase